MSKGTIILAMFLGLLLFYILYIVNKTAKDVNKLESFQNSVVVTKVIEEEKSTLTPNADGEASGTAIKTTTVKEVAAKDTKEVRPSINVVAANAKPTEEEDPPPKPIADPEKAIKDDKERYYFIGKHLFELQPENGASKFFEEVDTLSNQYKGLTQTEIKKKLMAYVNNNGKNDKVIIDKSTRDEIYGITGRMVEVTDKIKQQTKPAALASSKGLFEDFVQPSSYEMQYMAFESLKS
jgi:hypothetical protein